MTPFLSAAAIVCMLSGIALALGLRTSGRPDPAREHALWSGVLAAAILIMVGVVAAPRWGLPLPASMAGLVAPPINSSPAVPVDAAVVPTVSTVAFERPAPEVWNSLPFILGCLWLLGTVFLLGRFLVHLHWLHRRTRHAIPIVDPTITAVMAECADKLRIRSAVGVRFADVAGPIVWGVRSTVLLPHQAAGWSTAEWRAVLLHEFAHVSRHDFAWQSVGTVAGAMHWFNPVIWRMVRRQRASAELAADALAVSGVSKASYARALVDLAIRTTPSASTAFGGDTAGASLEDRLAALRSPNEARTPVAHPMLIGALLAAPAFLAAGARPVEFQSYSPPPQVSASEWRGDPGRELRVWVPHGTLIGRSAPSGPASVSAHWVNGSDVPLSIVASWDDGRRNIEVTRADGLPIDAPVEVRVAVPSSVDLILWTDSGTIDADVRAGISGGTVDGDVRVRTPSWARLYTTTGTITAEVGELDSRDTRIVSQMGDINLVAPVASHGQRLRRGEVRAPMGHVLWRTREDTGPP